MPEIEKQMIEARKILAALNGVLGEDRDIVLLLREYGDAIQRTKHAMEREGVAKACAICDETSRGGCCYPGVEEWYDSTLLAINLLLGSEIPATREIPGACFFCGLRGCRLVARHAFCVNFFCPDLASRLRGAPRDRLNDAAARELLFGYRLERFIRSRLGSMRSSLSLP